MKKIYIATLPALGWDCVVGVFKADSVDDVKKGLADQSGISMEEFYKWEKEDPHIIREIDIIEI